MSQRAILTAVWVILLIGVVFVLFNFNLVKLPERTVEFAGSVDVIENNVVFATGYFSKDGKPIPGKEEKVSIEIALDQETKLTRLAIKIPANAGSFNVADLEKEESSTDLATIINDSAEHVVGLEAVLKQGSSDTKFVGKTLYFRVPVFNNEN